MREKDGPHSCRTHRIPLSRGMKCYFLLFLLGPVLGTWVPESGPERPGPQAQRRSRAQSCLRAGGSSSFPVQDAALPPARQGPLLGHPCVSPSRGLRDSARTHLQGHYGWGRPSPTSAHAAHGHSPPCTAVPPSGTRCSRAGTGRPPEAAGGARTMRRGWQTGDKGR